MSVKKNVYMYINNYMYVYIYIIYVYMYVYICIYICKGWRPVKVAVVLPSSPDIHVFGKLCS